MATSTHERRPGQGATFEKTTRPDVPPSVAPPTDNGRARALEGADSWWLGPNAVALHTLAASGQSFTVVDHAAMGVPPADHRTRLGALFSSFERRGLIEVVGATLVWRDGRSTPVRVWVGTDLAKASFDEAAA